MRVLKSEEKQAIRDCLKPHGCFVDVTGSIDEESGEILVYLPEARAISSIESMAKDIEAAFKKNGQMKVRIN